jgi:hypothetical protein
MPGSLNNLFCSKIWWACCYSTMPIYAVLCINQTDREGLILLTTSYLLIMDTAHARYTHLWTWMPCGTALTGAYEHNLLDMEPDKGSSTVLLPRRWRVHPAGSIETAAVSTSICSKAVLRCMAPCMRTCCSSPTHTPPCFVHV